AGAVYVFVRDDQTQWSQQAYVKGSNTTSYDLFGWSVALSSDGNALAVGAIAEGGGGAGIDHHPILSIPSSGAVYLFLRDSEAQWSQQAYVKASNPDPDDLFGSSVQLSGDGSMLAVGASQEASLAAGIGGFQKNNVAPYAGAAYLF
ncbi:MAG TPA: hypothetical protein VK034_15600, partial [Enhygromyxa sp.]|nr:hypothetical protein [Enhygromyxa sp.]